MTRALLIAKVHVAKKQLGLDDDTYRDVLRRATGRDSAADLNDVQLGNVIREFVRLGWKGGADLRTGRTPAGRLIRVLWREASREKSEASLRSMIRRVLGLADDVIPDPDMLTVADATKVVEALKAMKRQAAKRGADQ
ncbi:regulatory protein GemA [Inquilinus limosus]|uniref:regulatory protein GemA n=1 Tax=Inquilinus limosus TaxID=171674 RepID=UPI0004062F2D|nr:regulatory protein GemA [Inquilinus limosus]